MRKPTNAEVLKLVEEIILPFYKIERDMTFVVDDGYRNENDAEHSWSLALLACALAPHIDSKLDVGLISQFAVVHDLVEVYASDTSVWADDETLAQKAKNEHDALQKLKKKFAHFPWMIETIIAYEKQDTAEALYVRSIDKYIAFSIRFLERGRFFKEQQITKETFEKTIKIPYAKAQGHKGAAAYLDLMIEEYHKHPEQFFTK